MAVIALQTIDLTGLAEYTLAAASAAGDTLANDGRTILVVDAGTGAVQVTINSLQASNFGTDENTVVTVADGERALIGPFQKARFNAIDGTIGITYDSETSVTVAALVLHPQGW
jgi:hypothetical protein